MTNSASAAPAHLAPLAFLLLIWHGALAADYLIVRFAMDFDLPSLTTAIEVSPVWARIGWALGVWLGLIGALFAMMRDDAAVLIFFAAFLAMLLAVVGAELAGLPEMLFGLHRHATLGALVLVPLIGWIYTRTMKRAGVLH